LTVQTAADLNGSLDGVKIAVVFGDANSFKDTTSANPQTQFLFIGSTAEGTAGNISLVVNRPQDLAFMAGYLASITAEDWRSGGLLAGGALPIDQEADAFINGGKLVCGNCSPIYPPYNAPTY
jgi:basic membrane lipoprotein Med (substrate-binding protein (PBP1-ABC) superfamily)